ncbi:ABC transporter permease [Camelliibacillus cellulosilyticus]|uniref:ABC transporter permease n=1 Tax=Camelliibacillus cellulosilyticus TaxID=2174486 RepID=A0ABV9GT39_9BACL
MGRYVLKRIGYMIVTLFVVITLTFLTMKLLPGTPYRNAQKLSPEQIAILNHKYGFDLPIPVQFVKYLNNMIHGDLGISFQFDGRSVSTILMEKFPVSADLGFEALVIGLFLGLVIGCIAALRRGTYVDYTAMVIAVLGTSIPAFVLAQLLQYFLGVKWQVFPVAFWQGPIYHVLPVFALMVGPMATIARYMRTEMVETLGSDYIEMARAKGLSRGVVITKHAVRNSLIPIVTILGPLVAGLITGSLVIENIFAIPGIGSSFVESINTNDYPMIMGTNILFAVLFVILVLLTDIAYGIIDPRIRVAGGSK